MGIHHRRQYFVDPKVQGALLIRTIMYWAFCLLTVTTLLLIWRTLTGPARMYYTQFDDLWFRYGPAVIASALLMPVVLFDVVRLSNRFAGPMYRLRREMRTLVRGEKVQPIHFREGDYWQDFAEDFNALAARVQNENEPTCGPAASQPIDAQSDPNERSASIA